MKNVLFISHDAAMFGAQQMLLTLLSGIDTRIITPFLIVPYRGALYDLAQAQGIPTFVQPLAHWIPGRWKIQKVGRYLSITHFLTRFLSNVAAIKAIAQKVGADAIYSNTVTFAEGAVAARRLRIPHVWHIHEPIFENSELWPFLPERVYKSVIARHSSKIIFPSRSLADVYNYTPTTYEVIYNGLEFESTFDRAGAKQALVARLGVPPNSKLVGIVGSFNLRKDHETYFRMAHEVRARRDDVLFCVVGSGSAEELSHVKSLVGHLGLRDCVSFLGRWDGSIADFLSAIDVLAISSEQESFGLSGIEALSVQTPVVSTRCGGPEEIIRDGETGYLVGIRDYKTMADRIIRLLEDGTFAFQIGEKGRGDVTQRFSAKNYVHVVQTTILTC